jgi:RNA 2',3'-cyclic 3'-phosphodiesterase
MNFPESKRIFFALWPDAGVRGRLEKLLSMLPEGAGRPQVPEDLHLTLVFVGQANARYYESLRMAATRIEFEPFAFELARFGYFARAKVVSAEPVSVPPGLQDLARNLRHVLRGCGYKPERREYNPHVTLMRKAPPLPRLESFEPIPWRVDRFCLAESREPDEKGRRYRVLEAFPAV